MKKTKSLIATALLLVMLFAFAGCASNEQKTRITNAYDATKKAYDACISAYNDTANAGNENGYFAQYPDELTSINALRDQLLAIDTSLKDTKAAIDENIEYYTKDDADKVIDTMETMQSTMEQYQTALETAKTGVQQYPNAG